MTSILRLGDGYVKCNIAGWEGRADCEAVGGWASEAGQDGAWEEVTEALVDRTVGAVYGNLTELGGLATIFNGDANQHAGVPANYGAYRSANSGWFAKHFDAAKQFSRAVLWGWTDTRGFADGGGTGASVTITARGLNGTFQSGQEGDVLGTLTFTDPEGGGPVEIASNGNSSAYTDWCFFISYAASGGTCVGEAQLYEVTNGGGGPPPSDPLRLLTLIGDSHMDGRDYLADQSLYPNRANIQNFTRANAWVPAADPLGDTTGSLYPAIDYPDTHGTGPGMAIADQLLTHLAAKIGIVQSARGSTRVDEIQKGTAIYAAILAHSQAALAAAPSGSYHAAIVLFNGLADSAVQSNAMLWTYYAQKVVSDLKADLNAPNAAVVIISYGTNPNPSVFPYLSLVETQQQARWYVPGPAAFAAVPNLVVNQSIGHYDTPSEIALGRAAGDALAQIIP